MQQLRAARARGRVVLRELRDALLGVSVSESRKIETLLLDAGGVLLDLDYRYLERLCRARGVTISEETLSRYEAMARVDIHKAVNDGGRVSDLWRDYFHFILGHAGVAADDQPAVIDSLWEAHQKFGLWTVAIPDAVETVRELKEAGYRIGVVSNAEGRVEEDLEGAGFSGLFETVVDSHHVGVEKPDPKIFEIALERMGVGAESAVYVGDVPAVDVAGARAARLKPVLLDRHDLYADHDVERLRTIRDLPGWLSSARAAD
jgi:putative hydrolase of the HAD superfamily